MRRSDFRRRRSVSSLRGKGGVLSPRFLMFRWGRSEVVVYLDPREPVKKKAIERAKNKEALL